ncbi:unnamed protein product [Heterobilharzia americana]|nr:unnamed protein product [Heterobilharzia americana]
MTRLLADDGAQEKFKWMCSFVYDSCVEKKLVSVKDVEQLLEFLCDLENNDDAHYIESEYAHSFKTFLLGAAAVLFTRNLSELFHLNIKIPGGMLVRWLVRLLVEAEEVDLEYLSATLSFLLCLEHSLANQLKPVEQLHDSGRELLKSWKNSMSENKESPKGTKFLMRYRESSLVYELWSEMTQNMTHIQECRDLCTVTARNELAICCVQMFWSYNGWQHVLNKLNAVSSISISDDVNHIHARLKAVCSLSRLFLIASLEIPYIQLTNTVPTGDLLLSPANCTSQQQLFVSIPEKIIIEWIEVISKIIHSGCLWFANCILHRELDVLSSSKELLDEILSDLTSLYQQHLVRLLNCQMNSNILEMIRCLNFGSGVTVLNLFANSLPNIIPANQSDLLCLIESLNKWDRQLNLVPIKPLLLNYFSKLFKLSLTLLASDDSEYYGHGSDFFSTLKPDVQSLLSPSNRSSLASRTIMQKLNQKFDPNEFLDQSTQPTLLSRLFILCGLHFHTDLMRILTEMFSVIREQSRRFSGDSHQRYLGQDSSANLYQDLQIEDFKLFLDCTKQGLHFLNNLLSARSNLLKHHSSAGSMEIDQSSLKDSWEFISIIGYYLSKMTSYADETVAYELKNASYNSECHFSTLDEELSRIIYAFASSHYITGCALKHLGYSLNTMNHLSSDSGFPSSSTVTTTPITTVVNWPLWSGSHVFCLLSGHMLSILRSAESMITSEDSIKSFWLCFLTSVQKMIASSYELSAVKNIAVIEHQLIDIHPNLLQFACFLAGQSPGLTAKKQLLISLTQVFSDLNRAIWKQQGLPQHSEANSIKILLSEKQEQITHASYLWLRLIVILRYMLHYFYVPPNYLSRQLKPCMFLKSSQNYTQKKCCVIWEYSNIAQLSSKLHPYFLPLPLATTINSTDDCRPPFFYDLLTAATKQIDQSVNLSSTSSGSSTKKHSMHSSLPSPDGLAISSLASLGNYHEIFSSLLDHLDSLLLTDSFQRTSINIDFLLTECCQLPLCTYGLALYWRLLEILPPPRKFLKDLHLLTNMLTSQMVTDNQSVPRIFSSPSHFLYFIILLDRIQQNPTQPDYQFSGFSDDDNQATELKPDSPVVSSTAASANTTSASSSRSSTYSLLDSRTNLFKELKRLVHAQCSNKLPSSNDSESEEAKAAATEESINLLSSLIHPTALFSLLFECGSVQMRSYSMVLDSVGKNVKGITVGQLSYLCSLLQFLNVLTSQLLVLHESKGTKSSNTSSKPPIDSTESVKRAGKHRTRHAAGKARTISTTETPKSYVGSAGTTTLKEKKSICLLDAAVLDESPQDTLVTSINEENSSVGDASLTPKQISTMRLHSLNTGHTMLMTTVQLMYKLCQYVRSELGFPSWHYANLNTPVTILTENTGLLTLLCPNRLLEKNYLPSPNLSSSIVARKRLANSLKLSKLIYSEQFELLNEIATESNSSKCSALNQFNSNLSQCFYQILAYQYELALRRLTIKKEGSHDSIIKSFDNNIPSEPPCGQSALAINLSNYPTKTKCENETTSTTTVEYAKHLAKRIKLFQACCLLKRMNELCTLLVKQLFNLQGKTYTLNDLNNYQSLNTESYNAVQIICAMHYDPILTALNINLIYGEEKKLPSVAQYFAFIYCTYRTSSKSTTDRSSNGGQMKTLLYSRQLKKLLSHSLEDRLVHTVSHMARCLSNSGSSSLESRVSSYVCREAMGYMEVVLGNHRILKQFFSDPGDNVTDGNNPPNTPPYSSVTDLIIRKPTFNKAYFVNFFSSSTYNIPGTNAHTLDDIKHHDKTPSLLYQASTLRLLCVLLMRAINASARNRCSFGELVQLALDSCMFKSWKPGKDGNENTLSAYWLDNFLPDIASLDQTSDNELWFTDLLNNHNGLLSDNEELIETEEDMLTNLFDSGLETVNDQHNDGNHVSVNFYHADGMLLRTYSELISEWKHKRSLFRVVFYFERFTRLLASNWTDVASLREKYCNQLLSSAINVWRPRLSVPGSISVSSQPSSSSSTPSIEQSTISGQYDLTFLPYAITSLHCLSFGFSAGLVHTKLFSFFTHCADICYEFILEDEKNKKDKKLVHGNETDLLISMNLRHHKQASLIQSLESIYFYVSALMVALNPSSKMKLSDSDSLTAMMNSPSVRLDYWPNFFHTQPGLLNILMDHGLNYSGNNDNVSGSSLTDNLLSKTQIFSHLLSSHYSHDCKSTFRKKWNEFAIWNTASCTRLVNSLSQSDESSEPNPFNQLILNVDHQSDTDKSDDYDDCVEDDIYCSFPGPLINDSTCSFVATQKMFIDQHWYHCFTCSLHESHGVCSVCAKVCHAGHDLSYAKYSGFFCDCGAGQHGDSFCQAITPRILLPKDAFIDNCVQQNDNLFLQYINKNDLNNYLPWLTDGYHSFILPSGSSTELYYPPNRSSTTSVVVDDHRCPMNYSNGLSIMDKQESHLISLGSKPVKRRRKGSSTFTETQNEKTVSRQRSFSSVSSSGINPPASLDTALNTNANQSTNQMNLLPAWRELPSVSNTDSFPRSPLNQQQTSSVSNRSSNLRRAGAVRMRKISSDTHLVSGILKTLQVNEQQPRLSDIQIHQPNHQDNLPTNQYGAEMPCNSNVVKPNSLSSSLLGVDRQDSKRIQNLIYFLNLLDTHNCYTTTTTTKRKRKYSKRCNPCDTVLPKVDPNRFYCAQVVPNERKLVEYMRSQINSDETGSCRSKLMMMLCTSDVVSQAAEILMGSTEPGAKSLLSHLMDCSTGNGVKFRENSRLDQLKRMLSSERDSNPVIRMCSNIALPVPSMPAQSRSLWRTIFLAGHQLFRSTSPISAYDLSKYLIPQSPSGYPLTICNDADYNVGSKTIQSVPNIRHTPTSSDHLSSTVSSGRLVIHSLTDNLSGGISSFSPSSLSTTPINAIVSLPALSMSTAGNASRGTSASSNPVLLIQALASILASHEGSSSGENLFMSPLTGGGTSESPDINATAISFLPSSTALSLRELFGSRISNAVSSSATPVLTKPNSSVPGTSVSSGVVSCILRVPSPARSTCSYFLVVASTGPRSIVSGSSSGSVTTTPGTADNLKGPRSPFGQRGLMTIYNLDKFLIQIAEKQDRGLEEVAKLKAITALLHSRRFESQVESNDENKDSQKSLLHQPEKSTSIKRN